MTIHQPMTVRLLSVASVFSVAFLSAHRCGLRRGPMTLCRLSLVFGPLGNLHALQRLNFLFRQRPNSACRQIAEPHGPDGDPLEPLHFVADAGQQAADFAVAAFVEHHFQDRRPLPPALDSHMLHVGEAFGQVDAAVKLREHFLLDLPGDLDVVNLFDAVPRMREAVGQLAVVGDEDQPFARHIEPADAKHARRIRRQQIGHARPAGRIARRGNDAGRLVDGEVHQLRLRQHFAIDANFLLQRIDARAQLGDDLPIDFDAAFANQLFAFAPAGNAGGARTFCSRSPASSCVGFCWPAGAFALLPARNGADAASGLRRLTVLMAARWHVQFLGAYVDTHTRADIP